MLSAEGTVTVAPVNEEAMTPGLASCLADHEPRAVAVPAEKVHAAPGLPVGHGQVTESVGSLPPLLKLAGSGNTTSWETQRFLSKPRWGP